MNKFSTHSNIKSQYIIIVSKTNMGINGSRRALTDKQVICYAFDGKLMSYSNWKISYFTPSFLME